MPLSADGLRRTTTAQPFPTVSDDRLLEFKAPRGAFKFDAREPSKIGTDLPIPLCSGIGRALMLATPHRHAGARDR